MNFSWLEISKSALLSNIAQIKKNLKPQTKFIAVIKSNAYGHGLLEVAKIIKNQVDYFAVYDFDDALILRQNKITTPILMLGRIFSDQIKEAVANKIEISVSNFDLLEKAEKLESKTKLKIHLCIDSGLGRDGFLEEDFIKIGQKISHKNISVTGLYTHFAAPDDSAFDDYTEMQTKKLIWWKKKLNELEINPILHASSTAGSFIKKFECEFDAVRIGGGIYGLWPSEEVEKNNHLQTKLRPALSWKTKIVEIKNMKKGSAISYGCTHKLTHDSQIAILPVGYFDGIPRIASGKAFLLANNSKIAQLGRVTMNMIIVDVTTLKNVKIGDEITIIGGNEENEISAKDWGIWSQSFNYEITTRINPKLLRKIVA